MWRRVHTQEPHLVAACIKVSEVAVAEAQPSELRASRQAGYEVSREGTHRRRGGAVEHEERHVAGNDANADIRDITEGNGVVIPGGPQRVVAIAWGHEPATKLQ